MSEAVAEPGPTEPGTAEEVSVDREALVAAQPFVALLPEGLRPLVVQLFQARRYGFGEVLVTQGDEPDGFYVVAEGTARVVLTPPSGQETALGRMGPGDSFGETALLRGERRTATVRASSGDVIALVLDRDVFTALLAVHPEVGPALAAQARVRSVERFLRSRSVLASLPSSGLVELLDLLHPVALAAGEVLFGQGEAANALYLIEDGRVRVVDDADGGRVLRYLRTGDLFGEQALEPGQVRGATIVAVDDTRLLRLGAEEAHALARRHPAVGAQLEELAGDWRRRAAGRVPLDFADQAPAEPGSGRDGSDRGEAGADGSEAAPGGPNGPTVGADPTLALATPFAADRPGGEDPASSPRPRLRSRLRRRRFPLVRQVDEMDCGPACLAMVARHHGHPVALSAIRRAVGTSLDGSSLRGIIRGGRALGLDTEAVRVAPDQLDALPLPAIVHWEGNHWIVLHEVGPTAVRVADPALGPRRLTREELAAGWSGYAALATPTPALADAPRASSGLGWVLPFFRPHRRSLLVALVLTLLAAGVGVVIPVLGQYQVDEGILAGDRGVVAALAGVEVALGGVVVALGLLRSRLLARAAVAVDTDTLDHLTTTLLSLPLSFLETRRTGDLERRMSSMQQVNEVLTQSGISAVVSLCTLVVVLAVMATYSVALTAAFVAVLAGYTVFIRRAVTRVSPIYAVLEAAFGRYTSKQIDLLKGIETVKVSGVPANVEAGMRHELDRLGRDRFRSAWSMARTDSLTSLVGLLCFAAFGYLSALHVLDGHFSLGQFMAFNVLAGLAIGPAQELAGLFDEYAQLTVHLQRLQDVFEEDPEQHDRRDALLPVPTLEGQVTIRDLTFAFDGADEGATPVLRHIDLDVAPGTTVALVGRSGSGKSTLLRLLAGLLEPTAGSIAYDHVDLRDLDHRQLRRRIGYVLQQPYLFDASIGANIGLKGGVPGRARPVSEAVDDEEVRRAAQIADADGFISRLPFGYATPIGESGLRLSGGQAQRISIARAVYGSPAVLLLDEATSALDAESERHVKDNLARVLDGRTAFVVAHRLSTIRDADLIVVLDAGRIVERGTHEELMRRDGIYAYLHAQQ